MRHVRHRMEIGSKVTIFFSSQSTIMPNRAISRRIGAASALSKTLRADSQFDEALQALLQGANLSEIHSLIQLTSSKRLMQFDATQQTQIFLGPYF